MSLHAITAAIMFSASLVAVPASAGTASEAITAVIDAGEFDLTSESGLDRLGRKIDRVAREVCGMDEINRGRQFAAGPARACYRDAMAIARRQVAQLVSKNGLGG